MRERQDERQTYPFYWFDETVETTLNPDKNNIQSLTAEVLRAIQIRIPVEIGLITACLKTQAFCLYCSDHIKVVAGHYDKAVRVLERQAAYNLERYPKTGLLRQTGQLILAGLNELTGCLYNRYPSYLPPPSDEIAGAVLPTSFLSKVLCALSADQLGIILRAATDAGLLVGRSFRKICTAVAPYLSTPWKTDIKADTMRSHATRPEIHDKEVAIDLLEKMIAKIKGYR